MGTHDQWIQQACQMYTTRLATTSNMEIRTEWHKTNDALLKSVVGTDLAAAAAAAAATAVDNNQDSGRSATVVLLDPQGKMPSSEEFSEQLYDWLEEGGSRLVFCIGGAEGLPPELKTGYVQLSSQQQQKQQQKQKQKQKGGTRKATSTAGRSSTTTTKQLPLLSLSKLTFTHQFARILLIEQIYRATEIRRGSSYHK